MPGSEQAYEVAVVGGGIVGTALAYYLAREGAGPVVLLEKSELGSGTTGGSFGGVRQQFTLPLEVEMSKRGLRFWKNVEADLGSPCAFHQDGYLLLTVQDQIAAEFEAAAEGQRALGLTNVHMLTPPQIAEVAPWISTEGLVAGCWTPEDGHMTPTEGVVALAGAARRLGVEIREGWPVARVEKAASGWRVEGTENLVAKQVVVAAGYWTPELLRPFGLDLDIRLAYQYLSITEPAWPGQRVPMTIDVDSGLCVEREGGCLLLAVLGRNPPPASNSEMDYEIIRRARIRAPELLDLKIARSIVARPAAGGDGMPYVGEIEEGLWTVCFVAHGAMHGPPVAEAIARAMAGRPEPGLDLEPWLPRRKPSPQNTIWWRRPQPATPVLVAD